MTGFIVAIIIIGFIAGGYFVMSRLDRFLGSHDISDVKDTEYRKRRRK